MSRWFTLLIAMSCFLFLSNLYGQQLPNKFTDELYSTNFYQPVGLTFDEDGNTYIWERRGQVHIVDTNGVKLPTPLIDISSEVANFKDHGLLGFVLDPSFKENGHYYLYYAVQRFHLMHYGTAYYHPDSTDDHKATIGRITRYTADPATNFTTTLPNSRKVLVGESASTGIPILYHSHAVCDLEFGTDGTLLASFGDGSSHLGGDLSGEAKGADVNRAIADGIITPDMDIGVYKSQYLKTMNGKLIRIDPSTGDGLPSNPYFDPANPRSAQSRVWALGLRNPYRISLRPQTGSHFAPDGDPGTFYIGDVGSNKWEEINVVENGGENFGWPITEGMAVHAYYWSQPAPVNPLSTNPLFGVNGCDKEFFSFREMFLHVPVKGDNWGIPNPCDPVEFMPTTSFPQRHIPPRITWNNYLGNPPSKTRIPYFNGDAFQPFNVDDPAAQVEADTFSGSCVIGGDFYTATAFPEKYHGAYFAADISWWIKAFYFDAENNLTAVEPFYQDVKEIIHLSVNPYDGAIYYINLSGDIHRITYGGTPAPVAVAKYDKNYGGNNITVQFSADESYSPFDYPLSYHWDFGDGDSSILKNPSHTFSTTATTPTSFNVVLTVTDSIGTASEAEVIVSLNNTPPTVKIISFEDGDLYPIHQSSQLSLLADAEDAEQSNESLTYEWQPFLHHNAHFHPEPSDTNKNSNILISPIGCDGDTYHYRVRLKVTDKEGLSTMVEQSVFPNCSGVFADWLNFTGKASDQNVQLNWELDNTTAITHYEIQRSPHFWNFQTIGQATPNETSFIDETPILGDNYYRLKIFNTDRAYDYSPVVKVKFPEPGVVEIFPNPVTNILNLRFNQNSNTARFRLFDTTGRVVLERNYGAIGKDEIRRLLVEKFKTGLYYYFIELDNSVVSGSVLIGS